MKRMMVFVGTGLWIAASLGGFFALLKYDGTPGPATASPGAWPAEAATPRQPGNFTLIMAAHPRCPCTRASIEELGRVLAGRRNPVDAIVLFYKPRGAAWTPTDLWRQAAAIPGVTAIWDEDGMEAARFGAQTSGHALLFDPQGKLLFSGGVTSSRGHFGPSKGNQSLAAWLTPDEAGAGEAPVFGCPLADPQPTCTQGNKACQQPE